MQKAAPLPHCGTDNALIMFVSYIHNTFMQFIDVLDPVFVDLLLHP
jgi:hypothetical protein